MADCTTGLVGVTRNTNLPFWGDLDSDLKEQLQVSASGLFIDELPGGPDLTTVDEQELMESMLKNGLLAIGSAEKILRDDIIMKLNALYRLGKKKFYGNIGRLDVSGNLNVAGTFQGMRLRAKEPIGGYLDISGIKVNVNAGATFNVIIAGGNVHDLGPDVLHALPVTTTAGSWSAVSVPDGGLKLPLQVKGIAQEYYIYFDKVAAGNILPKNNLIKCNCGGDSVLAAFDYVSAKGIAFSDLANVSTVGGDNYAHGVSLAAQLYCDNSMIICREFDNSEPIAIAMAWADAYKAGELWIENLFKTNFVSREMVNSREYFWGKRNHFRSEYDMRVQQIGTNLTLDDTNCYVCKQSRMVLQGIKV